ncbi:MAG TPA: glycoside hydrolase family 32 protein [Candidatus Hydrogenedentes bacterium]|nr:glycoside hydrolase family 32 protein [Candidatus Hydrogenedentota bacterium]
MNRVCPAAVVFFVLFLAGARAGEPGPDILIADFEGADYGAWTVEGEAFGPGPARGTLPNQMEVSGFEGQGLVNSFFNGDGATGMLTSPPFRLERDYLAFLIGGGMHPGETCINLLVNGEVVRTATGPNDKAGGTERLDWFSWDVSGLRGQTAIIRIVDAHTGGWGHINIDHIVQSERSIGTEETTRELAITEDYLSIEFGAEQGGRCQASLRVDGQLVRHAVGQNRNEPYWLTWDVSRLKGQNGTLSIIEVTRGAHRIADTVRHDGEVRGVLYVTDRLYEESYRPQFHFTPKTNWTNDPNGLVHYDGEYHLFFQHNPEGINWGNMTWGHAVSPDLMHWTQLDHAIHPDEYGTIFSGSAVVDAENTSGFQAGPHPPLVAVFTYAGEFGTPKRPYTQAIAYSNDRGRTFTKYAGNPVVENLGPGNRDPKVFWHAPAAKWVMVLYAGTRNDFVLLGSPDLKTWERLSNITFPEGHECPELFELPVDGDPANTRWVLWEAAGRHLIGRFDGVTFTPETEVLTSEWGRNCYAGQTYNNAPGGRRIFIAWMSGGNYPGMPFNQQMTFPREFTLRSTGDGPRLFARPIAEIETIREARGHWADAALEPGANPLKELKGDLWDIDAVLRPADGARVALTVRGTPIVYDAAKATLSCLDTSADVPLQDGALSLRVLVDRTSIEIFANDGRVVMSYCFLPDLLDSSLALTCEEGSARIGRMDVYAVRPTWPRTP